MTSDNIGIGPVIGLGVDLAIALLLYKWYNRTNKAADDLKGAEKCVIGEELLDKLKTSSEGYIPYARVEGEVHPMGPSLHSAHSESQKGVIQQITLEEHKSKRIQGVWSDVKNKLRDTLESVPFVLRPWLSKEESSVEIQVLQPLAAEFLQDELTVTHDLFKPTEATSLVSRGLDRIFGEYIKGYHENEKMLLSNSLLLGVGEIVLVDGKLKLQPPRSDLRYIITKKTFPEVIKTLESRSFWIKVFYIGSCTIGAAILAHILYKLIKKVREERTRLNFLSEVREMRARTAEQQATGQGVDNASSNADTSCVVCLANPREFVLLNCGHICICGECLYQLPQPRKCPVCRSAVERYVTTYNP